MSRIMILSASTGAGHNQAANNLKKEFIAAGHQVALVDIFKSTDKAMNAIITESYDIMAKSIPDAFGFLYHSFDRKELNEYIIKNTFLLVEMRLKKTIRKIKPDLIISTHPFGVGIVTKLKVKNNFEIPFIQVVTDFKAHYAYVDSKVDAYITASDFTKNSLVERGIKEDIIYTYGIPTKEEFNSYADRKFDAGKVFRILVMGGSMGLKAMEESVEILVNADLSVHITVICATNVDLEKKLIDKFETYITSGELEVLGFVNNVDEYMQNSDLIVTKPGGLTTTEAIKKSIPMIIPFAIPGQEIENTRFMVEHNMAIEVRDIKLLPGYIKRLIENPDEYMEMVHNMKELSRKYSVDKIVELAEKLIDKK